MLIRIGVIEEFMHLVTSAIKVPLDAAFLTLKPAINRASAVIEEPLWRCFRCIAASCRLQELRLHQIESVVDVVRREGGTLSRRSICHGREGPYGPGRGPPRRLACCLHLRSGLHQEANAALSAVGGETGVMVNWTGPVYNQQVMHEKPTLPPGAGTYWVVAGKPRGATTVWPDVNLCVNVSRESCL